MQNCGLLVKMKAKAGKEKELSEFLESALPLAQAETGTATWFAFSIDKNTFGIFDTFPSEIERNRHVEGEIARALFAKAPTLLETAPSIEKIDLLAFKV